MAIYACVGFGLYGTALKEEGTLIGICGLIKRDALEDVDIGFAFLPQFWSQGYAYEAASEVIAENRFWASNGSWRSPHRIISVQPGCSKSWACILNG